MKFDFEIKTEPTLCALVAILIVAVCSGSLASIAIYLDNPLTGIYCATILAIIVFWPFGSTLVDLLLPQAHHSLPHRWLPFETVHSSNYGSGKKIIPPLPSPTT
jgi:hypothetical protein